VPRPLPKSHALRLKAFGSGRPIAVALVAG
jgi:hypothetical protein